MIAMCPPNMTTPLAPMNDSNSRAYQLLRCAASSCNTYVCAGMIACTRLLAWCHQSGFRLDLGWHGPCFACCRSTDAVIASLSYCCWLQAASLSHVKSRRAVQAVLVELSVCTFLALVVLTIYSFYHFCFYIIWTGACRVVSDKSAGASYSCARLLRRYNEG